MSPQISSTDYPIQDRWLIKPVIRTLLIYIPTFLFVAVFIIVSPENHSAKITAGFLFTLLGSMLLMILATILIPLVIMVVMRAYFSFNSDASYLNLAQGVIKKQERHLPYFSIQHILIKRGLLDRMLGLSTLIIENSTFGGGAVSVSSAWGRGEAEGEQTEMLGFSGNKVQIPGLKAEHAEELRSILLSKMKENEAIETGSGL
jgi:membrane protein YdbS with pleckstrin-like domain